MIFKLIKNLIVFSLLSFHSIGFAEHFKIALAVWTGYDSNIQGFKEVLTKNGLIEGKNVDYIEIKKAEIKNIHKSDSYEKALIALKEQNIDLVYSLTTPGTTLVKRIVSQDLPVVFSIVTYPADSGLIESFEYSGNNLVGTSNYVPLSYQVNLLVSLLPNAKSVAIFHRRGEPNSKIQASNLYRLLKRKAIKVYDIEVENLEDLRVRANDVSSNVDVYVTTTDTLMQNGGEEILIDLSNRNKIPILSSNKEGIEKGATFGVVADLYQLGKVSGDMAAQILLDQIEPRKLQTKVQEMPLYLVNRKSASVQNIIPSERLRSKITWIE